jgi:hypothetical protein
VFVHIFERKSAKKSAPPYMYFPPLITPFPFPEGQSSSSQSAQELVDKYKLTPHTHDVSPPDPMFVLYQMDPQEFNRRVGPSAAVKLSEAQEEGGSSTPASMGLHFIVRHFSLKIFTHMSAVQKTCWNMSQSM